jgi:hypothetical protein
MYVNDGEGIVNFKTGLEMARNIAGAKEYVRQCFF